MIARLKASPFIAPIFVFLLTPPPAWPFYVETHRDITAAAFELSSTASTLRDLGIDPTRQVNGGFLRGLRPPKQWLIQGAEDEDDTLSRNFARYRNHFYDPYYNRGLTTALTEGEPAPDWALEDHREFLTQSYSYRDARQAFLTALIARDPGERETALARAFETLGHVLHVNQDMASPSHTRNDSHGGGIFGPSSLYEEYLNQREVRDRLNLNGTPIRLDLPRRYWTTRDGRGLADFTNRNFVSEGTNFTALSEGAIGRGGYPNPVLHLGTDEQGRPFETVLDIQTQLVPGLRDRQGNLINGKVAFFANNFQDPITGEALRNERMTSFSLFDRELQRKGATPLFTLNRFNVEAQAAFLVPRAVGYSASLLDYLFRGQLDFVTYPDRNDPTQLNLFFWNNSAETMTGSFTLYTEDKQGRRSPVPGASVGGITLSGTATPGGEDSYELTFTLDPAVQLGGLALVFSGTLGTEEGAVAGKVRPWEPAIFVIQEFAELTGEERVETRLPAVDPDTGRMYGWDGTATTIRSKDPRLQRAGGQFLASEGLVAGEFISRIWLAAGPGNTLRLNGDTDVGLEWSRDSGPAVVPRTWEVVADPNQSPDPYYHRLWFPPTLYVETRNGTQWSSDLAWWTRNTSYGTSRVSYAPWDCQRTDSLMAAFTTSTTTFVEMSLGNPFTPVSENGFIPVEGIAGFAPGTFLVEEPQESDLYPPCPGNKSFTTLYVSVFVDPYSTPTNYGIVTQGQAAYRWIDWSGAGMPPGPPSAAPQLVPELRLRRQYSPEELLRYQQLGITPPEYEVQLR